MKSKRILVPVEDLKELIEAWDSWAGYHAPEIGEEHLKRFNRLREKINKEVGNNNAV